jgi:hypothetical protein
MTREMESGRKRESGREREREQDREGGGGGLREVLTSYLHPVPRVRAFSEGPCRVCACACVYTHTLISTLTH